MNPFEEFKSNMSSSKDVKKYFTPSTPVKNPDNLKGRNNEVKAILKTLTSIGKHCLIYGDRGIGKSSLALSSVNGAVENKIIENKVFKFQCGEETTFEKIIHQLLIDVDPDYASRKLEVTRKAGGGIAGVFKVEGGMENKITYEKEIIDPQTAARVISNIEGILLIDEFDVVNVKVKNSIAELIKQLSDEESKLKLIIVGIAKDGSSLSAQHPSMSRCLDEIKLNRVDDSSIIEILTIGETGLSISFSPEVKNKIVDLSNGFPYFTHLLAYESSSLCLTENKTCIDQDIFERSVRLAVKNSEGNLSRDYNLAINSSKTSVYKDILLSATRLKKEHFSIKDWIQQIQKDTGKLYNSQSMSNFTGRLLKIEKGGVLEKVSHGLYKIKDPRMASFIIMNAI